MAVHRKSHVSTAFCVERGGWIETWFRYFPPLIENLKDSISATRRQWNDTRGSWSVRESERDALLKVFESHGYDVEWLFTREPEVPESIKEDRDLALLGLRVGASLGLVRSAYRVAALEHHPDRGGSVEVMAKINGAYERLEGRYGAK